MGLGWTQLIQIMDSAPCFLKATSVRTVRSRPLGERRGVLTERRADVADVAEWSKESHWGQSSGQLHETAWFLYQSPTCPKKKQRE